MKGLARRLRHSGLVAGDDIGDALRAIRHSGRLSAGIVLVLTVGIAAGTAAFSFLDASFLRPLPYPTAERLVALNERQDGIDHFNRVSGSTFAALRTEEGVFAQVEGYHGSRAHQLTDGERRTSATGLRSTPGLLHVFGHEPLHGSLPPTTGNSKDVVVLGYSLWQESFGGDPEAIGRTILLDGEPTPVVAVMPAGFSFPGREGFWILTSSAAALESAGGLHAVALLTHGSNPARARARLAELSVAAPAAGGLPELEIRDEVIDRHRGAANLPWIVFGAGIVLLLLVTTNASSLVLVWHLRRRGEWAIRAAFGTTPAHLTRKALLECTTLGLLAGALGVAVAWVVMDFFGRTLADTFPPWLTLQVDARILLFTFSACLVAVLLAGLAPSLRLQSTPLAETLKGTGQGLTGTKGEHRARRGLIAAQVAASTVLLSSTVLLLGTAEQLDRVNPGFPVHEILEVSFNFSGELQVEASARADQIARNAHEALGFEGVAAASHAGQFAGLRSEVENGLEPGEARSLPFGMSVEVVGHNYFDVLGLEVEQGRGFTDADAPTEPKVGVVTRAAAREMWPDDSALGQHLSLPGDGPVIRIVGVVSDRNQVLSGRDGIRVAAVEHVYLSTSQALTRDPRLFLRTEGAASEFSSVLLARLDALDSQQAVAYTTPLDERFSITAGIALALGRIFLGLAVAGLLVSALGLFGLVAHGVAVRRREIGIRLAVGADPGSVVRLMTGQGLRPVFKGAVVGLILSAAVTPLLGLLTYEVRLWNPLVLVALMATIAFVGLLASWLPARRAARIPPAGVLTAQ